MSTPTTPKFNIGDWCYLKQAVSRDRSYMNVNGKEVERLLLQDRYLITDVQLFQNSNHGWEIYYRFNMTSIEKQITAREMELCDEAEARAILSLIARNGHRP